MSYTRRGFKPCHRPLVAALAEAQMIAGYWLRSGYTNRANGAAEFLRQTVEGLPCHVRIGLLRGDSGFSDTRVLQSAEKLALRYIVAARLTHPVQALCRHGDEHRQATEVPGIGVQEVELDAPGGRPALIRQRIEQRSQSGGKLLSEAPGYRLQVGEVDRAVDQGLSLVDAPSRGGARVNWCKPTDFGLPTFAGRPKSKSRSGSPTR